MDFPRPIQDHALRVLEFDAVRRRVVEQATCALGQERARTMQPAWRDDAVIQLQAETAEGVRLLELPGSIPLGGIHDIRPAIRAASVEGLLEPQILLLVADTAAAGRKLKQYLLQRREQAPKLGEMARFLGEFPHLETDVHEAISDAGEVRDEASPALSRVRKEVRQVRARMMDRLHSILRSPAYRDMLQDSVVTTRDGRYCIPVKNEYRVQFGGLVHDQSSSGATLFMEPTPVVEMGNELRQLEVKERQEVERILRDLTARIGKVAPELSETVELLGNLDFIFARGKLAQQMDATAPVLNKEGFVGLKRARHPLLQPPVVPLDLDLGCAFKVLVITGPNTGGKTVSLKTVGLLALMTQSGLHIPADEGSTMPVFRGVYADIGDEQSIQQSLSTFSGHITNIAGILKEVEATASRSLVLLDEVGAGTDPTEGAALAKSILSWLLQKGARTIATTHYGELKEFAYSTDGVENASVEFNHQTLRPTYRLLVGIPGTSNAFSISARLGLPQPLVDNARGMIGTDRAVLSDVIQRLTEEQRATEVDLRKASQAARDVEAKREEYARQLRQLQADRTDTLERARRQADDMLRNARREVERVRDELKRLEKQVQRAKAETGEGPSVQKMRDHLQKVSVRVERQVERVDRRAPKETPLPPPEVIETDTTPPGVGDLVWIASLDQRGTVHSIADGKAQVIVGSMRMTVPLAGLQRIMAPKPVVAQPVVTSAAGGMADLRMKARSNISPEVHLRGMRADDALLRLDEYLDEACLAGLSPVRIVHGKGSGALRKAVREFLHDHAHVARYHQPPEEEGGDGVTIAELRE